MDSEQEIKSNLNLIIIGHKLNALKLALSKEQMEIYLDSIEQSKSELKSQLEKDLPHEQVDEVLKGLDS